jgi:hypothetical protein
MTTTKKTHEEMESEMEEIFRPMDRASNQYRRGALG